MVKPYPVYTQQTVVVGWFLCTLIFFVSSARFGSVETLRNDPGISLTYDPVSTECLAKDCYWDIFGLSISLDDSPQPHLKEPTANCWDAPQISHNSICYLLFHQNEIFHMSADSGPKVQYFPSFSSVFGFHRLLEKNLSLHFSPAHLSADEGVVK